MSPLLVVGGGIAGSSVAYFAAQAGLDVLLIDAGKHAASDVPSALINPVRGQNGHVVERGLEGVHFTFALLDRLQAHGFEVPHGRNGVLRPVPDEKTFLKWSRNLPADHPHSWLEAGPEESHLLPHWHRVLQLPDGGWVDGQAFCRALQEASGARLLKGVVSHLSPGAVTLQEGNQLSGTVVFCGGSFGADLLGFSGTHRRGSLLLLDRPLSDRPVSFGIYATPTRKGGALGSTFETPEDRCNAHGLPLQSLAWLMDKASQTFTDLSAGWNGTWTGVRYSGSQLPAGMLALTGLGSKGFLLGPLLAHELVHNTLIPLLNQ